MQWSVKIGENDYKIDLPTSLVDNEPFFADINGRRKRLRWQRTTQTLYILEENGVERSLCLRSSQVQRFQGESQHNVNAEYIEGGIAGPQNIELAVSPHIPGQEHRNKAAANKGTVIRSRITGKVLKVFVKPKDEVKPGDTLLIIEAMKMENKIFAPAGGTVTTVGVKDGDSVSTGAKLISIEN